MEGLGLVKLAARDRGEPCWIAPETVVAISPGFDPDTTRVDYLIGDEGGFSLIVMGSTEDVHAALSGADARAEAMLPTGSVDAEVEALLAAEAEEEAGNAG